MGNGVNKVAAEELRIKLSELCYKAIACDVTEDKKHIDLSSEPLIFVCAAGLAGSTADDVSKEVAIFRAHKATPIVVADDGDVRYPGVATIPVPPIDPALAFVLSTMAGHLFGYEAALAIDASAIPLREAREVIERAVGSEVTADAVLARVRVEIGRPAEQYIDGLRNSRYDGHLEASTAVRLAGLLPRRAVRPSRRGVPVGIRQGRFPGCPARRPRRRPDAGDRGADPPDRCHQASGQDRDRRHLA